MVIPPLFMVFVAVFALLSLLIVPVWLFLRLESMRGDIATSTHQVTMMTTDYTSILAESVALKSQVADVCAQLKAAEVRAISTEETIRSLGNKINSRERVEKKREAAENRKEEPEYEESGWEQQSLPLFTQQQPTEVPQPSKRQFGAIR